MGYRSNGGNSRSTGQPVHSGSGSSVRRLGDDVTKKPGEPAEDLDGRKLVPSTPQPAIRGTKADVASIPDMLFGLKSANPDRSHTATQSQATKDWTRKP